MASILGKRRRPAGKRYVTQRTRKQYRSLRYVPPGTLFRAAPLRTGGFYGPGQRSLMEAKVVDTDPANYSMDTTGSVTLINGVATGSDFTDRIGRKIILKSVYVRGIIKPVDSQTNDALCRMMVVYDMQANGAAPAITDILKSATSQSQLNMNNRDRFKIIFDKVVALGARDIASGYTGLVNVVPIKKYKKLRHETVFSGTLSTIGSISTGALYLVNVGDQSSGLGGNFSGSVRVRFIDA